MLASLFRNLFRRRDTQPPPTVAGADTAYALMQSGKTAQAVEAFEALLARQPDDAALRNDLGLCYVQLDRNLDAQQAFTLALDLDANLQQARVNLGNLFLKMNNPEEAAGHYRIALAARPDNAGLWHHLAMSLASAGQADESLACSRRALELSPDDEVIRSNLLFTMVLAPHATAGDLYAETRAWAAQRANPLSVAAAPNSNVREPGRPLRIAYVSADLRNHPIASYLEPLLANHDKSRFSIACYANHATEDNISNRLRALADCWLNVSSLGDEAFADRVRSDGTDILVDLSGHTFGNRLLSMARKPAPVQITYLGFAASTGMDAMGYRLSDDQFDPPEIGDDLYVETLLRLPDSLWCYRPLGEFETPSPTPALKNGHVTLGSLNGFHKIHQGLLDDWAALMRQLPDSRLVMVTVPEGKTRQRVLDTFANAGVAAERIDIRGRLSGAAFRALHRECDIALDAFPCGGGATTCEVLWTGIPVVSRKGHTPVSRAGASILGTVGLGELVAHDRQSFIDIVTTLAGSPARVAALRIGMRERMQSSPLMQEARFTRSLEGLYRQAWRAWCENQN